MSDGHRATLEDGGVFIRVSIDLTAPVVSKDSAEFIEKPMFFGTVESVGINVVAVLVADVTSR